MLWVVQYMYEMETGRQSWHDVGCYITPNNVSAIEDVFAAISRLPRWAELLVTGNFNPNLVEP